MKYENAKQKRNKIRIREREQWRKKKTKEILLCDTMNIKISIQ